MLTLAPVSRKFYMSAMDALKSQFPRPGRVQWIGLRLKRDVPMQEVTEAFAVAGRGLEGDRYNSGSGKRGVTLIQAEHLPVIAALSGHEKIAPATLRRNLVISGVPLTSLIGKRFRIGEVLLEGTDHCDPCERMEKALGQGGFNAMSGHGGLCARILQGGKISLGDSLNVVLQQESLF
jgi:MOSC domain-containing protein YiiM